MHTLPPSEYKSLLKTGFYQVFPSDASLPKVSQEISKISDIPIADIQDNCGNCPHHIPPKDELKYIGITFREKASARCGIHKTVFGRHPPHNDHQVETLIKEIPNTSFCPSAAGIRRGFEKIQIAINRISHLILNTAPGSQNYPDVMIRMARKSREKYKKFINEYNLPDFSRER